MKSPSFKNRVFLWMLLVFSPFCLLLYLISGRTSYQHWKPRRDPPAVPRCTPSTSMRNINHSPTTISPEKDVTNNNTATFRVKAGGSYRPDYKESRDRLAILVPYRERETHLSIFLRHMHRFLQRQQRDYTIFIVELALPATFNRGLLANVGYKAAISLGNYTCIIVHDVDLLAVDDRNIYRCSNSSRRVRHLSVANSKFLYRLPYDTYLGGVTAITRDQYEAANGFSNIYFGWGGEDDDFRHRLKQQNITIERPAIDVGRYEALPHTKDKHNPPNKKRDMYVSKWKINAAIDGLISVMKYTNYTISLEPLYTHVFATADEQNITKEFGYNLTNHARR